MNNSNLNISVLYVEDKEETRKNITEMLSRRVKELHVAKNGEEAFSLYTKYKPDLILSDIRMPGMSGLILVEKIKELNPHIKIIMMTAFTEHDYLIKSINIQVDGYIIKPTHKSKLLTAIKKQANIILLEKEAQLHDQVIKRSEEKYRLLFDLLPFGGEIINPKGVITNCSKSTAHMLGYSMSEIIGAPVTKFIDEQTAKKYKHSFPRLLSGISLSVEAIMIHKNGSKINVLRIAQPILGENGKVASILALSVNITKRKQAEEAINHQNIELKIRNEELDAFSHTVAHDLKNPLGTILGFANLLYDDYSTITKDEFEKYVSLIIKSGNKTQQIIDNLLLFASVRKEDTKIEEFNMGLIVKEALNRYKHKITQTKAIIKLPNYWPDILGNQSWVEEVWINYISNALKYGGTPPKIEIGYDIINNTTPTSNTIRFWIHDNGNGILKEDQKLIFQKFGRLNQTNIKGHGLGLSIVKRIIEKLKGEVGVESTEGEGSMFYFTLPANIKLVKLNHKSDIYPLKILIAENEPTSTNLLKILVKNISKETLYANTGKEAIEIYENNLDIDLILMDINMPVMNGYEAVKHIRKLNKNVIIIAQTAYALPGDSEKAIESGCSDYISKPIDKEKLLEMINKHFLS